MSIQSYEERLRSFVGRSLAPPATGQDPVNTPMIRHWVEAMQDPNPVYLDVEAARATGRDGVVAPATMMQAWTMRGYAATVVPDEGTTTGSELMELLAEGGYSSVVATDSEFEFHRELVPGDHVTASEAVESISVEKRTALGAGRFVTTLRTYTDQHGAVVATQRWRLLRFRPAAEPGKSSPSGGLTSSAPRDSRNSPLFPVEGRVRRPRPSVNRDNSFWFEAAREHRLVIQRCTACTALRHPPGPCCGECGSFEWDTVESSGHGTVYSFVVNHHPRHPAFDYPLVVAVVELAEGTRLVSDLAGVEPADVAIDMPVELEWLDADDELTLPVFQPTGKER